ncbi:MAG: glycosyltransferase family A protein [Bacteroidota bacterium]|nr:glycosyltransferase family A protein [Bacteroidota bacterium]MDP3144350.1 glycosyltransferase family A protein [Bacteroidota bacterium]
MISVVIPLYNKEKNIKDTVNSVLNQTYENFELIIVNDGSTDGGVEVVNKINDSRIKLFNQLNKGVSSARNVGINNSKYELIALLDGDDLWDETYLEKMIQLTVDFEHASLYGCASYFRWPNKLITESTYGLELGYRGYLNNYFEIACENTLYNSTSVVFKKKDFLEIGSFNENFTKGEDIDLWIRFALHKKTVFYNVPLTYYILDAPNRAGKIIVLKEKSLIWNLNKYDSFTKTHTQLKKFIDSWKLAHITNYLKGESTEVDDIKELLMNLDLRKLSLFYRVLYYLPKFAHRPFYNLWQKKKSLTNA